MGARLVLGQSPLFQPGYIVRADAPADTVRGYVDVYRATTRLGYIRFQATPEAPIEKLRARYLLAAGTADMRQAFRSKQLSNDSVRLLEVIASGPLSLYTGYVANSPADYLLGEANQPLLPLTRPQFLPVLQGVVANCATLNLRDRRRARLQYSREPLGKVVDEYNRCVAPRTSRYYPGSGLLRPRLSIQAGLQRNLMWYEEKGRLFGNQRAETVSYIVGAGAVLPLHSNLHGVVEAQYIRPAAVIQVRERPGAMANYYQRTLDLKVHALQLPLLLRLQPGRPERRFHGYAEGGGGVFLVLSRRARITDTPEVSTDRPYAYDLPMRNNGFMIRAGAGVNHRSSWGTLGLGAHWQNNYIGSTLISGYGLKQTSVVLTYSR
ncbi:hypothetical protein D3Y59_12385 [Hymenobacter oligotrophus]|uniref:PorT family protein n=1 Tax=Hymenobacter oligotrophus TaxID=2319843 RepID=A0A3B7R113_9BACT|nr:hypothetical protein D3Y59_12385 [Hymenobacter oligotrophus]